LSFQIDQLNLQNSELKDRVNQLEAENKRLKEENRKLLEMQSSSSFLLATDPVVIQAQSPPLTPPMQTSPPLTPTSSSEESTSFDLFSEDYSDDLFTSNWASDFPSKIPFTFMAVFFCLLLFYPSSLVQQPLPSTPTSFVEQKPTVIPPQTQSISQGFNGRHLLTADQEPELESISRDRNNSRPQAKKTVLTMEDVLNDELTFTDTPILEGIKESYRLEANFTTRLPLLISNHSISISF